jgi:polar amino acid transport system permease protein
LIGGLAISAESAIGGFVIAVVFGLLLALARRSSVRLISWTTAAFVEFVRDTPLLVQLYFLFFVLPRYTITLPALTTGIIALGLHFSTYTAEVYRAGIESVPREQWDASLALNFSRLRTLTAVILPQALPPVIPALGNYLIAMFKDSAVLSAIAVVEMLQTAKIIGSETFRYLEPLTMVGLLYLILSYPSSVLVRRLETVMSTARLAR